MEIQVFEKNPVVGVGDDLCLIAHADGTTALVQEYSAVSTVDDLGEQSWEMNFYWDSGTMQYGSGTIEWYMPKLDHVESCGVWVEEGELMDYDGVMSLNEHFIALLEAVGITVGEDFRD